MVVLALGGVVPFLSFFVEKKFHAEVEAELAANPQAPAALLSPADEPGPQPAAVGPPCEFAYPAAVFGPWTGFSMCGRAAPQSRLVR